MTTATKLKMTFATIIGLAVVMTASKVIQFPPSSNGKRPANDNYTLSVQFDPPFRLDPVVVVVRVDGVKIIDTDTRLSPWIETMTAEHGALVTLQAISLGINKLDCFIARNGVPVTPHGYDHVEGAGTVNCTT